MYKIIGEHGAFWFYDALLNKVYDANQTPICLANVPKAQSLLADTHYKFLKFKDIEGLHSALSPSDKYFPYTTKLTELTIQLGLKCNYKCVYCSQNGCIPDDPSPTDLENFLVRLKKSNIPFETLRIIQLWGGEPLVYWKHLKRLVKFIREEIPQFKGYFHTTTNGTLFDKEKAEFFLKYGVYCQFSHDGVNHKLQRNTEDWLDDPEKRDLILRFLRDNNMGDINVTFGPMNNPNIFDSLELFERMLPGVQICARAPLRCDSTNAHLMQLFTKKNIQIAKDNFYKLLTLQPGDRFYATTNPTRYRLVDMCKNFISGQSPANIMFNCPTMQRYEIVFNLRGNLLPCHGSSENMGIGHGTIDVLDQCYFDQFLSVAHRPMCQNCPYIQFCQGPCGMYRETDGHIHCRSTLWTWQAWFDAVWKLIFNEKPVEITQCSLS